MRAVGSPHMPRMTCGNEAAVVRSTMMTLAERTGGTVFAGRNDVDTGIRLALDDLRAGYTLGFLAPEDAPAGPRRIEVRVRRARVRLRYRESYTVGQ